jgi:hypothetical protein
VLDCSCEFDSMSTSLLVTSLVTGSFASSRIRLLIGSSGATLPRSLLLEIADEEASVSLPSLVTAADAWLAGNACIERLRNWDAERRLPPFASPWPPLLLAGHVGGGGGGRAEDEGDTAAPAVAERWARGEDT